MCYRIVLKVNLTHIIEIMHIKKLNSFYLMITDLASTIKLLDIF